MPSPGRYTLFEDLCILTYWRHNATLAHGRDSRKSGYEASHHTLGPRAAHQGAKATHGAQMSKGEGSVASLPVIEQAQKR
jgi:hypothetical protein